MKQTGILMRPDMVQATLRGDKTETRRIIKPQPPNNGKPVKIWNGWPSRAPFGVNNNVVSCPYGKVGDILWVRETWAIRGWRDGETLYSYRADGDIPPKIRYDEDWICRWYPSIHMPKSAARIWLEITDIQAERVQDITEEGARAEGAFKVWESIEGNFFHPETETVRMVGDVGDYKTGFKAIWVNINGRKSWDNNDWVFVIKYKVLSTTGKPDDI